MNETIYFKRHLYANRRGREEVFATLPGPSGYHHASVLKKDFFIQ